MLNKVLTGHNNLINTNIIIKVEQLHKIIVSNLQLLNYLE